MPASPFPARGAAMLALATAALAACNGDSTAPGSGGAPLTQAEAQAMGDEMRSEVAGLANGASLFRMLSPSFQIPPEATRVFHGPRVFNPPPNCPTLSENPPTDTDGDHVPDNLTITFDPATCVFDHPSHDASFELSGSITVSDPSATDPGLRVRFDAFQSKFTVQDTLFWLRRADGVWQLLTSSAGFSATDSTTVRHESSQRPSTELAKAWQVDFTADAGGTFDPGAELPSGDFDIAGKTVRTRGASSRSFTVTSLSPLHWDAGCNADEKITSGELELVHTGPRGTATVNIVWNGCGVEPTVTLTSTPPAA